MIVKAASTDALEDQGGCRRALQAGSLATAMKDHADVVQRYFGQLADFKSRSFAALNTAFVQTARSSTCRTALSWTTPIHIIFVSGADARPSWRTRAR